MELRQLHYFVAVAEEGHFTRAAERVLIAQPAISQQIRRLETELGERLFDRDHRNVRLTAAGHALLPEARATLAAADRARAAVSSLSGLLTGRLTVGAFEGTPERLLARALGQFHRDHPAVEVRVREDYAAGLLAAVRRGELDAAITGLPDDRKPPPALRIDKIAREPLVVAASPAHPLASQPGIPITRLEGEPMVALTPDSTQRTHIERACRAAGFTPNITAETRHLGLLWDLVSEGIGIAVLPRPSQPPGHGQLALIPITQPRRYVRIIAASSAAAPSPAARAFLGIATASDLTGLHLSARRRRRAGWSRRSPVMRMRAAGPAPPG
jgi:DNA-binding transcriptional LysR family regulator